MSDSRKSKNLRNTKTGLNINSNILMLIILISIIVVLFIILLVKQNKHKPINNELNEDLYTLFQEIDTESKALGAINEESQKDTTINIVAVGDILCETPIYESVYDENTNKYDFSSIFANVLKYTSEADIAIGLLETNFVEGEKISGTGKYNSPKEFAEELKNIGLDVLNTANNHSLDYGHEGIKSTISYINSLGIDTTGTYSAEKKADEVLIKNVKGINLAFLSYTQDYKNYKSQMKENEYVINLIDKEKMKSDIKKAKEEGADYVFVHMHWGDLTSTVQNSLQEELSNFLFENGADFVLGSHPASLQPMETRTTSENKNIFISYSTGNFISASKYNYSDIEMILNIEITKSKATGETSLAKVTYTPVYLLDNGVSSDNRYVLLDIKEEIKKYENNENGSVSEPIYNKLKQALKDIEKLVREENR